MPVHLYYMTAWMEPDGTVHFRSDIYDRDPTPRHLKEGLWTYGRTRGHPRIHVGARGFIAR